MNFLLLGFVSGLDVLVNVFIFSGVFRSNFDINEAADFSAMLAWSVVLAAVLFGGAEQTIDHKRVIPANLVGSPRIAAYACLAVCAWLVSPVSFTRAAPVAATLLLTAIAGIRMIGRAVAYARGRYVEETIISLIETALIVMLTAIDLSILSAYVWARAAGVALRASSLSKLTATRQARIDMWSYSFSAVAPALYFNVYYAVLPAFVSSESLVRFRLIQSALVPMSFLGSLFARARIIFRNDLAGYLKLFDVPRRDQSSLAFGVSVLLPAVITCVYLAVLTFVLLPMSLGEAALAVLYCTLIFHRAQLYSLLTLKVGPSSRARIASIGIVLIGLSVLPMATMASVTVSVLYAMLSVVETLLLALSVAALRRSGQDTVL